MVPLSKFRLKRKSFRDVRPPTFRLMVPIRLFESRLSIVRVVSEYSSPGRVPENEFDPKFIEVIRDIIPSSDGRLPVCRLVSTFILSTNHQLGAA